MNTEPMPFLHALRLASLIAAGAAIATVAVAVAAAHAGAVLARRCRWVLDDETDETLPADQLGVYDPSGADEAPPP